MVKSITSSAAFKMLSLYRSIQKVNSEEGLDEFLNKQRNKNNSTYKLPKVIFLSNMKVEDNYGGQCIVAEHIKKPNKKQCIFYIYGGGYISHPQPYHLRFIDNICSKTGIKIVAPMYPLLPDTTVEEVANVVLNAYRKVVNEFGAENVTLMGDAAGGLIALSLCMDLKKNNIPMPSSLILLSPWLDLEMKDDESSAISLKDTLNLHMTITYVGKKLTSGEGYEDYHLTPVDDDLSDLPPIRIYIGGHDINRPYARTLAANCKKYNVDMKYYEYVDMEYNFVMYNAPESGDAVRRICDYILPEGYEPLVDLKITPRILIDSSNIDDADVIKMGRSLASILMERYLFASGSRNVYRSKKELFKELERLRPINERPYNLPAYIIFKTDVYKSVRNEMECFELRPENPEPGKIIIYIHGGAFMTKPLSLHWTLMDKLAIGSNQTLIAPLYPLLPEHNYKETVINMRNLYLDLLKEYPADGITMMGDSAGGGISMVMCQIFAKEGIPQPKNIILISPGLDFTMTNPKIKEIADKDPLTMPNCIPVIGELWADGTPIDDPSISPIKGRFDNITSSITIVTGTHDILNPDSFKLKNKAKEEGKEVTYLEYKNMDHDFALMPLPEAVDAQDAMINIIKE